MKIPSKINGFYFFEDFPNFKPNLSPKDIFNLGSFGGTYWRPIYSMFYKKKIKNRYKRYPSSWWENIPQQKLITSWDNYNIYINKYKVKVGTTLEYWELKGWIKKSHPYGWVDWYCDFYSGKRGKDDERQIKRWNGIAGERGRFKKNLINQIIKKKSEWNDHKISPKIRQTLQHWGYKLTKKDFLKLKKVNGMITK